MGKMVACPQGFACTVQCGAGHVCAMATIKCPNDYPCQIVCLAPQDQACQNAIIDCAPTGSCDLQCGSGNQACQGAQLICGGNACQASCTSDAGADHPSVTCGGACTCKGC
jgi:hypothetical protein